MSRVDIGKLEIGGIHPRRGETGCLLLEIGDAERTAKTDKLAEELRRELADFEELRVTRPQKTAELRVRDLVDAATQGNVATAVASAGECDISLVRVGVIRSAPDGLGTVWVQCPLGAANRVARTGIGVGWMVARVEVLPPRPLRCFKCLERSHVRRSCPSAIDRSR